MKVKKATDVFGEWAEKGKDVGMEEGHAISVNEMLNFGLKERQNLEKNFSFLDVGCGNGWVVRKVINNSFCNRAMGIDGAKQMIAKAKSREGGEYILADLDSFNLREKFDLIHSMEVLYYLEDPTEVIRKISDSWLKHDGRLIIGLDHYHENIQSHSWQEVVGTRMHMFKAEEWIQMFEAAGFSQVESWYSNRHEDWTGTLIVTGKKKI